MDDSIPAFNNYRDSLLLLLDHCDRFERFLRYALDYEYNLDLLRDSVDGLPDDEKEFEIKQAMPVMLGGLLENWQQEMLYECRLERDSDAAEHGKHTALNHMFEQIESEYRKTTQLLDKFCETGILEDPPIRHWYFECYHDPAEVVVQTALS